MNLARWGLLASRSEWRHVLSGPIQRVRECIGDFARIENRSQLHPRLLVSIGSFFRSGTGQTSPSPVAA
jgi:hypothetical protein